MKLGIRSLIFTLLGAALASPGMATPVLHPTNRQQLENITNITNSNLVGDSEDSRLVWVLPPMSGTAQSGQLHTIGANVGFCQEMASMQQSSLRIQKRIEDLTMKIMDLAEERQRRQDMASQAVAESEAFIRERNLTALADLDDRINLIEMRLSSLYEELESCTSCQPIRAEIRDLQQEKRNKTGERQRVAAEHSRDLRTYNQKRARAVALQAQADNATKAYEDTETLAHEAKQRIIDGYTHLGRLYGAQAPFNYNSGWEANVAQLRRDNPGWRFEMIDTANAVISAAMATSTFLDYLSPFIAFEVSGASTQGGTIEHRSYPATLSANATLNLIGACPLLYPSSFPGVAETSGPMKYGLTIAYNFPSLYRNNVKFTYNMYKLYTKVSSSGSKGGFFRSSSWSRVEEREYFRDSFTAHWTETDPQNSLSEEEKLQIESNVRIELLRRLAAFADPAAFNNYVLLNPPAIPTRGGLVIAEDLGKACGAKSPYCAGAAIFLRGLDAIFGSSSTAANYLHSQDKELTETWTRDVVRMTPWITVYSAEME